MSAFRSSLLTHITGLEQPRAQREKRNFLKENVKNLRDMQKKMEAMKIKNAPTQRNLADPKGKRGFTSVQLRREGGVRKAKVFLASSSESSSSSSSSSSHPSAVSTPPTAVNSKARAGSRKLPGKTADPDPEKTVKNIVRECRDQSIAYQKQIPIRYRC
ncbi:hypothetical protein AAG570_006049 [Ranatra chinensis]|uniref:Uncharacterized protein n=1 Tax=Ranatra chinensis TaxID=642074 RepID=A0ABD0YFB6_9HEMI